MAVTRVGEVSCHRALTVGAVVLSSVGGQRKQASCCDKGVHVADYSYTPRNFIGEADAHRLASCLPGSSTSCDGTRGTISQISVTFDFRAFRDLHRSTPTRPPAHVCGLTHLRPVCVRMLVRSRKCSRELGR